FVKPEAIDAFKAEMDAAGADYTFVNYPGAVHSFTSPGATARGKKFSLPLAYNAQADGDSWRKTMHFFHTIFN
ncbi:MAG: dienelactone hydrolase family protein, partial [Rhodospirillaceae bacterium]|nr:dienelactone hydrolase family protein [Rhodospirillaceae bacterium]